MQFPANVGVGRTGTGIHARHPPVAHGREHHRNHGNQNGGDNVALAGIAEYAVRRHGRGWLDDDDAVKNQVPERERCVEAVARKRK